ncbi:MAG: dihydrodipicolinate synthase family protein [Halobacteriaceae archaeon]
MATPAVADALADLITGLVTPFDDDLAVDHEALATNAARLSGRGVSTFFATSNVSEYHSLTHEERVAVTETSVAALPGEAVVLAGAGGSTRTAMDLARRYEAVGADVVMVMPPHHTFRHEDGLLEHYRRIGDATELPTVPYLRGFEPSASFVAALSELESVAGIKWTVPDVPLFAEAVAAGADDVVWINGLGELFAVPLAVEGASGMASGIGNVEPRLGRALFDALERGDLERAREIRDVAAPFMRFRTETGEGNTLPHATSVPALKVALEAEGLTGGRVRPPLVELSERDRKRARAYWREIRAFVDDALAT